MEKSNIILFGAITFVLLSMAIVSAIDIYSGQSYSFESEQFDYFEVVGNSSNMDGMNITWLDGNTTISFDVKYKSDSFTLILFNEKEVIKEVQVGGSGGGGTKTIYRYKDNNGTYQVIEKPGETITKTETTPGETIETNKIPIWIWYIVGGLSLILIIFIIILIKIYLYPPEGIV